MKSKKYAQLRLKSPSNALTAEIEWLYTRSNGLERSSANYLELNFHSENENLKWSEFITLWFQTEFRFLVYNNEAQEK